jgi:hypothetical protein
MRPQVFLGDAVRAELALQPDPATAAAIEALLGLAPVPSAGEMTGSIAGGDSAPAIDPDAGAPTAVDRDPGAARPRAVPPRLRDPAARTPFGVAPSHVRRVQAAPQPPQAAVWLPDAEPLGRSGMDDLAEPLEPEPLFRAEWTTTLLSELLGVQVATGPHDVEGMVRLAADGQPLVELRHPRHTLSFGVQMLIDSAPGMMPFAQDCARLRRDVARVVGGSVRVMRFVGCPSRGVGAGARPRDRYRPPPLPTPVLLVTDLGLGRPEFNGDPADVGEWLDFAELLKPERPRPVAVVPYPLDRIPRALAAALSVVEWDRTTTIQSVRRAR